jgi:uncharacterized membrane protein
MKKTVVLVSVVTLLFITACGVSSGFGFRTVKGSGEVITVQRDMSGFNRVDICCGMTLILSQGESESLEIKADDNFMAEIVTRVVCFLIY